MKIFVLISTLLFCPVFAAHVVEVNGNKLILEFKKEEQLPQLGQTLKIRRHAKHNILVDTGKVKIAQVDGLFAVAHIVKNGSELASGMFKKYSFVMAGDIATYPKVSIQRNFTLAPTVSLSYFDIFGDPNSEPSSFEFTPEGIHLLSHAVPKLLKSRVSKLMIEAHTDSLGSFDRNQSESIQRALTVKHFIVNKFKVNEDRIVTLGFGGSEPIAGMYEPGFIRKNRRIVLKLISEYSENP